jgi:hypothetical protein
VVFLCPEQGSDDEGPDMARYGWKWEERGNKWLTMVQSGEKWSKVVFVLKSGGI